MEERIEQHKLYRELLTSTHIIINREIFPCLHIILIPIITHAFKLRHNTTQMMNIISLGHCEYHWELTKHFWQGYIYTATARVD